jgi:hypothetical protein
VDSNVGLTAICGLDNLVEGREGGCWGDWAERLFLHDPGIIGDVLEQGRRIKIAHIAQTLPASYDLGASGFRVGDKGIHDVETALGDHRAHLRAFVEAIADLKPASARAKTVNEVLVKRLVHIESGRSGADLSSIAGARRLAVASWCRSLAST